MAAESMRRLFRANPARYHAVRAALAPGWHPDCGSAVMSDHRAVKEWLARYSLGRVDDAEYVGTEGRVVLVQSPSGDGYAVKTQLKTGSGNLEAEARALVMCVGLPHVVQPLANPATGDLAGVVIGGRTLAVLMRPCDGVPLRDAMRMPGWGVDMLQQCCRSLAQGVAGMHDRHLVH
eukprot:2498162-Rhodomonas_salina.1